MLAPTRGLSQHNHVLHLLLVPRHPPCALSSLIVEDAFLTLCSFQGANRSKNGRVSPDRERPEPMKADPSKLNSAEVRSTLVFLENSLERR